MHGFRTHRTGAILALSAAIGILLGCTANQSAQPPAPEPPTSAEFRVVAYNVHLLPEIAARVAGTRSKPEYRAAAIGRQLANFDVIGLCEVFDQGYAETLIKSFQAAAPQKLNLVRSPQPEGRVLAGDGLLLLTRFPIEATHSITYTHSSHFLSSGFKADAFARKGALHARLRLQESPPLTIDCFLTHLESRSPRARDSQVAELAAFVAKHSSAERPVVLLGDFNIRAVDISADDSSVKPTPARDDAASAKVAKSESKSNPQRATAYARLLAALAPAGRTLTDVVATAHTGPAGTSDPLAESGGDRIDFIFYSTSPKQSLVAANPAHQTLLDDQVPEGTLSDHAAVTCTMSTTLAPKSDSP